MIQYSIQRILLAIPTLLGITVISFLIMHLAPGDPAILLAGEDATDADIQVIREYLGLDKPLLVQYGTWLGRVLQGDLGISFYVQGASVTELILLRLPATLEIAITGLVLHQNGQRTRAPKAK